MTPDQLLAEQRELVRQFGILKEEAVILRASKPLMERINAAAQRAEEKLAEMTRALGAS